LKKKPWEKAERAGGGKSQRLGCGLKLPGGLATTRSVSSGHWRFIVNKVEPEKKLAMEDGRWRLQSMTRRDTGESETGQKKKKQKKARLVREGWGSASG